MNLVIQQLDTRDVIRVRRFIRNADNITPDELYRQAFGRDYEPHEPMMVDGGVGRAQPKQRSPYGTLYMQTYDAQGRNLSRMVRTAVDPREDARIVNAALELASAIKRGVAISPEALYRHVVGKKPKRPVVYWVGRFTMFKWRAAVAAADGDVSVVERRLRKQGFPQRIRDLILKGFL